MPEGWGVNAAGNVSKDPCEILDSGGLLPLGGAEQTSKVLSIWYQFFLQ